MLEAQVNELKECQISYPVLSLDKNGGVEREVRSKSHIDVLCNILIGGQIRGNQMSNNIDSYLSEQRSELERITYIVPIYEIQSFLIKKLLSKKFLEQLDKCFKTG